MAEGIYIVEYDRNKTAVGGTPTIYNGPYSSETRAEEKTPKDGDGIEYTIEWLSDFEASRLLS